MNLSSQFLIRASSVCIVLLFASTCTPKNRGSVNHGATTVPVSANPFVDPDQPPAIQDYHWEDFQEHVAKSGGEWVDLHNYSSYYLLQEDGTYRPCYARLSNGPLGFEPTLYVWRGVRLTRQQIPIAYYNTMSTFLGVPSKDFNVREIDAPLQFVDAGNDQFYAGHLDFTFHIFYYFRGYKIPKSDLPPTSGQHSCAVIPPSNLYKVQVVPISIPAYLAERLKPYAKE